MRPDVPIERLLSRAELAEVFNVAPATTKRRHWLALLGIPALRVNGLLRFRRADVEAALVRLAAQSCARPQRFRLIDQRADGAPRVVAELGSSVEAEAALAALKFAGATDARLEVIDIGSADA